MKALDQIELEDLTAKERTLVQQVLIEEAAMFSVDHTNVGSIKSTEMEIKLSNQTPSFAKFPISTKTRLCRAESTYRRLI